MEREVRSVRPTLDLAAAAREGIAVARCTVERLMRQLEWRGAIRGHTFKTTIFGKVAGRPADLVNRACVPPRSNALWVADLTYVAP